MPCRKYKAVTVEFTEDPDLQPYPQREAKTNEIVKCTVW